MGKKSLLTPEQLYILENKLTEFINNGNSDKEDFFTGLKSFYPEFKEFTNKQLDNQIIAQRRLTNSTKWPHFK